MCQRQCLEYHMTTVNFRNFEKTSKVKATFRRERTSNLTFFIHITNERGDFGAETTLHGLQCGYLSLNIINIIHVFIHLSSCFVDQMGRFLKRREQ